MIIKRISFAIVLSFLFYSCINSIDGNGNVIKEERSVDGFNKLDISGQFEILVNQGDEERVEIEADENLMELIQTDVKKNTLKIESTKRIGDAKALRIYITVKDLQDIDASGAIELKSKGTIESENLEIDISGAADVNLKLKVENLEMDMSGASETTLEGKADNFEIELSGAGELQAKGLKSRNVIVDISGAGSAVVHAKKTLHVEISGAGSVKYKGKPTISKEISGAGSLEEL